MKTYFGLIDTLGIECFYEFKNDTSHTELINTLNIRAQFNPHRFACVFKCQLTDDIVDKIKSYQIAQECIKSAKLLLTNASNSQATNDTNYNSLCNFFKNK